MRPYRSTDEIFVDESLNDLCSDKRDLGSAFDSSRYQQRARVRTKVSYEPHSRGDKKFNSQSRNTGFVVLILKLLRSIIIHTVARGVCLDRC